MRWSQGADRSPAQSELQAKQIADSLKENGCGGDPVLLALPSKMCLASAISLDGLNPRDRKAMLFRLEEQLPIAAEDFVADFIVADGRALGVAVLTRPLKSLIDSLARAGVSIANIVPGALLATMGQRASARVALIREENLVNIIELHNGSPRQWALVDSDAKSLRRASAMMGLEAISDVALHDIGEIDDCAAHRAAEILSGAARANRAPSRCALRRKIVSAHTGRGLTC